MKNKILIFLILYSTAGFFDIVAQKIDTVLIEGIYVRKYKKNDILQVINNKTKGNQIDIQFNEYFFTLKANNVVLGIEKAIPFYIENEYYKNTEVYKFINFNPLYLGQIKNTVKSDQSKYNSYFSCLSDTIHLYKFVLIK